MPSRVTISDALTRHLTGADQQMADHIACCRIREGLTEYLENALPRGKWRGFDDHLGSCRECQILLDEVRAVVTGVARLPREPMPVGMKKAIRETFAQHFAL